MRHQCFAVCTPGLEPLLLQELVALGVRSPRAVTGGVTFDATTRQLYASNVWSRTATRVLVRVARFHATDFAQLERNATTMDWSRWIPADRSVTIRVSSSRSQLYHTGAVEQRMRRVLGGADDAPETERQLVVIRIVADTVTVSVDSSGAPLYKRGWRQSSTKSPLRETLAAAMLLAADWRGDTPLVDPFCGSGTIPLEAAGLALGRAPGALRSFAFERWTTFEPGTMASVRADVGGHDAKRVPPIVACDRDAGAVSTTEDNAARAGVAEIVETRRMAVSELRPPGGSRPGWIITNPPYGRRISKGNDLRNLFARFGDVMRAQFAGWHAGVLAADVRLAGHAHLRLGEVMTTRNGGIPVHYLTGPIPVDDPARVDDGPPPR